MFGAGLNDPQATTQQAEQEPAPEEVASKRQAELNALKRKDLKAQARAAGVTQAEIDDADDEAQTKEILITLILQREASAADATAAAAARVAALRAELDALRRKDLKKRARDEGITQKEIDEADDEEDTKGILIALILQRAVVGQATQPEPQIAISTPRSFATSCFLAHYGVRPLG